MCWWLLLLQQQQTDSAAAAAAAATSPRDIKVVDSEQLKQSIITDLRTAEQIIRCLKIEQRFMNS